MNQIKYEVSKSNELIELDESFSLLKGHVAKFFNRCIERPSMENNLNNIFEARTHLESAITILKFIIEHSENELILKMNQDNYSSDLLEKYFENLFAIIDSMEDKLKTNVRDSNDRLITNKIIVTVSIKSLREKFIDYMDNLVINPIKNSLDKFRTAKNKDYQIKKDDQMVSIEKVKIFEYLLFREVWISAKIKGGTERKKANLSSGSSTLSLHETNISRSPKSRNNLNEMEVNTPPEIDDFPGIYTEGDF